MLLQSTVEFSPLHQGQVWLNTRSPEGRSGIQMCGPAEEKAHLLSWVYRPSAARTVARMIVTDSSW